MEKGKRQFFQCFKQKAHRFKTTCFSPEPTFQLQPVTHPVNMHKMEMRCHQNRVIFRENILQLGYPLIPKVNIIQVDEKPSFAFR